MQNHIKQLPDNTRFSDGQYYIGDLCYVIPDGKWSQLCDAMFDDNRELPTGVGDSEEGIFEFSDGTRIAIFSTRFGDGEYPTSEGDSLGVDSGTIGCILASTPWLKRDGIGNGSVHSMDDAFECTGNDGGNGILCFGHIDVYTGDEEDEIDDE